MKTIALATLAVVSFLTLGCGAAPSSSGDELAPEVSDDSVETTRKKAPNCSGAQGCAFAACYDGCLPTSNTDYCREYCKCRVYDKKTDMQCQMSNPYIDIKL